MARGYRPLFVFGIGIALALGVETQALAVKYGGEVRVMARTDPPSYNIYEGSSNDWSLPLMPQHSNLALFRPEAQIESIDTIMPEVATGWAWSYNDTTLTFKLREDVKFQDGKPVTSKDVKDTIDMVRGASPRKMRLNPRKSWWENIKEIRTNGDHEVAFVLKRPQPSLLAMLASGNTPILDASLSADDYRTKVNGSGPFRLKEHNRGKYVLLEKNPNYFVKGRPYMDGINYVIIPNRGTRLAAMQSGQLDISYPTESDQTAYELYKDVPGMRHFRSTTNSNFNVILNLKKPPFDNLKVRKAISMVLDREEFVKVIFNGAGVVSGANMRPPFGTFGLPIEELRKLPGYDPGALDENRERSRKLLAEVGYTEQKPLKLVMHVRTASIYINMASWAIDQMKRVGIAVDLKQVQTANWFPMVARREFQMLLNATGPNIDDPDVNLLENFGCGSQRNYSDYCDEITQKMINTQSEQTDQLTRVNMVHQIDRKLELDVARPIVGWRIDYYSYWSHVKNYYPHNSIYNFFRMQDVWLDRPAQ
ncbi:MAG: ABC transporter substrate-binding protein [Candidatus Lambdaproteobacteria bacterium]|nr:ABC transporter substrate-binding protein [Candidatus Lambdaproteobacteria bacterium]